MPHDVFDGVSVEVVPVVHREDDQDKTDHLSFVKEEVGRMNNLGRDGIDGIIGKPFCEIESGLLAIAKNRLRPPMIQHTQALARFALGLQLYGLLVDMLFPAMKLEDAKPDQVQQPWLQLSIGSSGVLFSFSSLGNLGRGWNGDFFQAENHLVFPFIASKDNRSPGGLLSYLGLMGSSSSPGFSETSSIHDVKEAGTSIGWPRTTSAHRPGRNGCVINRQEPLCASDSFLFFMRGGRLFSLFFDGRQMECRAEGLKQLAGAEGLAQKGDGATLHRFRFVALTTVCREKDDGYRMISGRQLILEF